MQGGKLVAPPQLDSPAERPAAHAGPQALANTPAPAAAGPAAAAAVPQAATKLKLGYRLGSCVSHLSVCSLSLPVCLPVLSVYVKVAPNRCSPTSRVGSMRPSSQANKG